LWIAAWLIAKLVPVFSDLLGLTNVLFASWFAFRLAGMFWIQVNWPTKPGKAETEGYEAGPAWGWRKWVLFAVNLLSVVLAAALVRFYGFLRLVGAKLADETCL